MSNLLSQASLVMIPSGYKEDVVYSPVPTNGNGDLTFTRASNGTRINSAGLVEVAPWNLLEYSEDFTNGVWSKYQSSVSANTTTAPNGTLTADSLIENTATDIHITFQIITISAGVTTISIYAKANTRNHIVLYSYDNVSQFYFSNIFDLSNGTTTGANQSIENVGNGWYRCSFTFTTTVSGSHYVYVALNNGTNINYAGNGTSGVYIWGYQANIGSTAKPYFPTTDRLNVPRLTYQNGGGGCPSLLLEKQSTNYALSSEDFSNATYWTASGSMTVTANQTTSPDGTQNADLFYDSGAVYKFVNLVPVGTYYSFSCYFKRVTATEMQITASDGVTGDLYSTFNLVNLTSQSSTSGDWTNNTTQIISMGNGWYRCVVSGLRGSGGSAIGYRIECGESAKSFYAWGYQAEASSYPTSYIPTTTSSATRVADECKKNGIGALIGGTSGTLFFDIKTNPTLSSSNYKQFCYYVTSGGSQSYLYLDGANKITTNATWGSLFYNTALQPNTRYKVALVFAPNDFALYINGVSVATASSGTPNNNVDLQIGQFNGTEMCEFVFNQYTHFPSRLTNAELASLTTI